MKNKNKYKNKTLPTFIIKANKGHEEDLCAAETLISWLGYKEYKMSCPNVQLKFTRYIYVYGDGDNIFVHRTLHPWDDRKVIPAKKLKEIENYIIKNILK